MSDISMCFNVDCKDRSKCYRYLATPNEYRQSFILGSSFDCRHFWDVEGEIFNIDLAELDLKNAKMMEDMRNMENRNE